MTGEGFKTFGEILKQIEGFVWGVPLIVLIILTGIYLTIRVRGLQVRHLGKALKFMVKNEEGGEGEVTSFGALCTALSATIGTGNIVGVATALAAGGPGALFWMIVAAFFGMATKYTEGFLAIKYRTIDEEGHVLGGPFYYIENGMGKKWKWLAKIFAFFGVCVGLMGIGTFTQVNGIASAVTNFFDPNTSWAISARRRWRRSTARASGWISGWPSAMRCPPSACGANTTSPAGESARNTVSRRGPTDAAKTRSARGCTATSAMRSPIWTTCASCCRNSRPRRGSCPSPASAWG